MDQLGQLFQGGSTTTYLMWGAAMVAVIGFLVLRSRKAKRGRAQAGGGVNSDVLDMLVFKRARMIVHTKTVARYGGTAHPKYLGQSIVPGAVVTSLSGRVKGKLPAIPEVTDINDKLQVRAALIARDIRSTMESRQRRNTPMMSIREMEGTPVVYDRGREKAFYPGPASMKNASATSSAAQIAAEDDFIRHGALQEENLKLFGLVAVICVALTILTGAGLVGFKIWLSVQ